MNSRALALRWSCAAAVLLIASATAFASDPWGLFPESGSLEADRVDGLTYLILWITGITLVGVQACMLWFLVKYRRQEGVRAKHTHGNHTVEMVWTVAPAAILVFLALYQMGLWNDLKQSKPGDNENAVPVRIFAKQFEWMFRYPGPDAQFDTADDLFSNKTLVVPVNRPVNAELRAMDVIHSFYLPNMRFKQDAVPGLHGRIWFRPNKPSVDRKPLRSSRGAEVKVDYYDIVCAELCGSQHTTMGAKLYVVSDEEFAKWQKGEEVTLASGTALPRPSRTDALQSPYDFIWSTWALQDDLRVVQPPKWHKGGPFYPDYKGDEE